MVCYGVAVTDPETGRTLAITGDTSWAIPERSREALATPDLLLADGITTADRCDAHPRGGTHHDAGDTPRTFGTKHMTVEGAIQMGEALDAARTRVVHVAHFTPPDRALRGATRRRRRTVRPLTATRRSAADASTTSNRAARDKFPRHRLPWR